MGPRGSKKDNGKVEAERPGTPEGMPGCPDLELNPCADLDLSSAHSSCCTPSAAGSCVDAWLPVGFAKFVRFVRLKRSTKASTLRRFGQREAVPDVAHPARRIPVRTRRSARSCSCPPCTHSLRCRYSSPAASGSACVPLRSGSMFAFVRLNGEPLSARATQLAFRPPVCGTTACPLTTKLCRVSNFEGPSFEPRCRSSSTWKRARRYAVAGNVAARIRRACTSTRAL